MNPTPGRWAGMALAAIFGALARARGTRALHAVGVCGRGTLKFEPGTDHGVPLLSGARSHSCLVRASRAVGLPRLPDIEGLALRIDGPDGGDLLFASTGAGMVTRHLLVPRLPFRLGTLTTLMPLRTAGGGLLLRLEPERGSRGHPGQGRAQRPPTAYRVWIAAPGRPWHERGRLDVAWEDGDCSRRHDPVGHPPAGTWFGATWARLRDPSYAASQRTPARIED